MNQDNNLNTIVGQMGIEKVFNEELTGTNGSRVYLADNNGNTLPNGIISETASNAGHDVYLSRPVIPKLSIFSLTVEDKLLP